MLRKRAESVVLRERDLEILGALEKWGVLGLGQLDGLLFRKEASVGERVRLFFNETNRKMYTLACYKRLADLEEAGYLRSLFYMNHPKVYVLTEVGHGILFDRGRAAISGFRRRISAAVLRHEVAANGVGILMQELLGLKVRSGLELLIINQTKESKNHGLGAFPDAWILDGHEPKAVEVELTQKSEARYKELIRIWKQRYPYGAKVLYLPAWPSGADYLLELTHKYEAYSVYVCNLQTFRNQAGNCPFFNRTYCYRKVEPSRELWLRTFEPPPTMPQDKGEPAAEAGASA